MAHVSMVEATAAAALPESRFNAYLRNEFRATLDRVQVTEQATNQALIVSSFNDAREISGARGPLGTTVRSLRETSGGNSVIIIGRSCVALATTWNSLPNGSPEQ